MGIFRLPVLSDLSRAWAKRTRGADGAVIDSAPKHVSPLGEKMELKKGKVHTEACELPIVHHCNLSCRSCTHMSPAAPKHCVDPAELARDLAIMSRHYHVRIVRIMGGEPLLHPRLGEILKIVRASGIADRVRVVTNGVLLPRQGDALWQNTDEVEVSVYPGRELSDEEMLQCKSRASAHSVKLDIKYFDRFRESHALLGTDDDQLVGRIYRSCSIAHAWSCHNINGGYFYKCPESFLLPAVLGEPQRARLKEDGLKIEDTSDFTDRLFEYLQSPEALSACRYCLGSVGTLFDHEEISRQHWCEPQNRTTEQLVDIKFLEILEETPGSPWMCTRGDVTNPANQAAVGRLGIDPKRRAS